ncbi:MAG: hypothetical protein ACRYG8_05405 [Janthinobacterium lividum]
MGCTALLLTPGPLTTSARTRATLDKDWGSRGAVFIALSKGVRTRLAALAGVSGTHSAIPVQGSGMFAVEAAVGSLVLRDGRLLVLVNGSYGRRIVTMATRLDRLHLAVAHGLVARGAGLQFCPIDRDMCELHQPCRAT